MNTEALFNIAQKLMPGGVNSPVRSFSSVGGVPIFIAKAQGPYMYDVDDRCYIDYVGSWGPMILGHNHPTIYEAVVWAARDGLSFGASTEKEIALAELITELVPSVEQVRMVSSGTEATMSAIRLARGVTGKKKIIKFSGCYHGHVDSLLVQAGSGLLTFNTPSSLGIPEETTMHTLTCVFNSTQSVEDAFKAYPENIACLIVEPVPGNMGCICPKPGFLSSLRALCDQYNTLLIFDEVMTGFRVALGGAQSYYRVQPDLTTLGKIVGGGMPIGVLGGRKEIMSYLTPLGPVYQAGTFSGNPISMAAGYACLSELKKRNTEKELLDKTEHLILGLKRLAKKHNIDIIVNYIRGMFSLFFTDQKEVTCLSCVQCCDQEKFKQFFRLMLTQGIYLAPSLFEANFVSLAHTRQVLDQTLAVVDSVFGQMT